MFGANEMDNVINLVSSAKTKVVLLVGMGFHSIKW
jgi:hypothetical protein